MLLIYVAFAGMKGLRTILTMERGLRRAMEASIPPKEDEADLVPTNAWGLGRKTSRTADTTAELRYRTRFAWRFMNLPCVYGRSAIERAAHGFAGVNVRS